MYKEQKPFEISPYDHPDIYPGPRPNSSFIYFKGRAHKIVEKKGVPVEKLTVQYPEPEQMEGCGEESHITIQEFLEKNDLQSISERVPLAAYGSNVCLAQLKYKFSLNPNVNDFVICLRGRMKDSDIVYGSFLAPYGSLPAIIAPLEETQTEIWLTFIDPQQLKHMNGTEGGYELREHASQKLKLETQEKFEKVYAYYFPHALSIGRKWYRFKDITGTSPLESVWQADMLNKIKELAGFSGTREEFIHRLRWDWSFFSGINTFLKSYDYPFDHPDWLLPQSIQTIKSIKRSF